MSSLKQNNLYNNLPNISPIDGGPSINTINTLQNQSQGLFAQITQANTNIFDPYTTLSISAEEKEYLETIALAADLLASEVISPQEYFKLKLLLRSKDGEVRNAGIIFLNEKAKL